MPVSSAVMKEFNSIYKLDPKFAKGNGNNRHVQKLNGRRVTLAIKASAAAAAKAAATAKVAAAATAKAKAAAAAKAIAADKSKMKKIITHAASSAHAAHA